MVLSWPTGGVFTVRSEVEGLFDLPAVHHVPQPDSSVPGCAGQNRLDRTEAQAANRTLVAPQNLIDHSTDQSELAVFVAKISGNGPSTSSSLPVCMDHRKISKES